jgi:hypothetical protein
MIKIKISIAPLLLVLFLITGTVYGIYFIQSYLDSQAKKELIERNKIERELEKQRELEFSIEKEKIKVMQLEFEKRRQENAEKEKLEAEIMIQKQLAEAKERNEKEIKRLEQEEELRLNQIKIAQEKLEAFDSNCQIVTDLLKKSFFKNNIIIDTNRNTFNEIDPIYVQAQKLASTANLDYKSLNSYRDLQYNLNQVTPTYLEAKKKKESWDNYVNSINSPAKKKEEMEALKRGRETYEQRLNELQKEIKQKASERESYRRAHQTTEPANLGQPKRVN